MSRRAPDFASLTLEVKVRFDRKPGSLREGTAVLRQDKYQPLMLSQQASPSE